MQYDLLFRWFVGLGIDDPLWACGLHQEPGPTADDGHVAAPVRAAVLAHREVAPLLSDNHFPVDGTVVKARASMKSFQPKAGDTPPDDGPGGPSGPGTPAKDHTEPTPFATDQMPRPNGQNRNAEVDFRGEKWSNATHASTTDPDARLYKKSSGTGAIPCFIGHAMMESRPGLGALNESGLVPHSLRMVDSTVIRAHHQAAGAKGGLRDKVSAVQGVALRPRSTLAHRCRGGAVTTPVGSSRENS